MPSPSSSSSKACSAPASVPWSVSAAHSDQLLMINGRVRFADGQKDEKEKQLPSGALWELDSVVSDPVCQRLFRLFLVFSGNNHLLRTTEGRLLRYVGRAQARFLLVQIALLRDQLQVALDRPLPSVHSEEDAQLSNGGQLMATLAHQSQDPQQLTAADETERVTFRELLDLVLSVCPRRHQLDPVVDRLFARYVLQIVRKGFLLCRRVGSSPSSVAALPRAFGSLCRCLLQPNAGCSPAERIAAHRQQAARRAHSLCRRTRSQQRWTAFWCVLTPGQLHLWPLGPGSTKSQRGGGGVAELWGERKSDEAAGKMTVRLQRDSQVELMREEGEERRGGRRQEQMFGWLLATQSCLLEMAQFDELQRRLWIADLEVVIRKRRPSLLLRFDRLNSQRTSTIPFPPEIKTKAAAGEDGGRPAELPCVDGGAEKMILEREKRTLLEELEAERRALKDEETVRQMATRMLDEEVQRGDTLRRTVHFLASELETERGHRMRLEERLVESMFLGEERERQQEGGREEDQQPAEERGGLLEPPALAEGMLIAPERMVTPVPRSRRGRRLRESLKGKQKTKRTVKEEEDKGEKGAEDNGKAAQMRAEKKVEDEKETRDQQQQEQQQLGTFEQSTTVPADSLWEAVKGGCLQPVPPLPLMVMSMSTRSV